MLKLALVLANGERVRVQVIQAEFVVECPYCRLIGEANPEFTTIDPDQLYCKPSHKTRAYERRVRGVTAS